MLRAAILSLALIASPAAASTHYTAKPVAKAEKARLILRDTVWSCSDIGCAAPKGTSRPAIVCAVLVREVGVLAHFTIAGQAMPAPDLEKCNARAR